MTGETHSVYDMKFRRKFSINPYMNLRMKLGEMSFFKDWLHTDRGDPYPVITETPAAELTEATGDGRYAFANPSGETAAQSRLLGQHFPYASYEVTLRSMNDCGVGFLFRASAGDRSAYTKENEPEVRIFLGEQNGKIAPGYELLIGGVSQGIILQDFTTDFVPGMRFSVTARGKCFDVYLCTDKKPQIALKLDLPAFSHIGKYGTFVNAVAGLYCCAAPSGCAVIESVEFYLEAGVSHADMKPIRYEDGTPILSDGKVFMTMSSRLEAGGFQTVISWNPSGCEMKLEGAIFFDCGDDIWCADVASSVLFNRDTGEWYIWACSFSHGHVLCHGTSLGDLRYGIHVIDAELMPYENVTESKNDILAAHAGVEASFHATLSDDTLWMAKSGDEDPDFVYDRASGKWYMTICRGVEEEGKSRYRYFLFESDRPFGGYVYKDRTRSGANTGGSIIRVGGKLHFCCGSDFDHRAQYNVYDLADLSRCTSLRCDYDDGGFRGWGTIIPIPCGSRTKYMWMTFDRHGGSDYTWSYGNIYVYESDLMNPRYGGTLQYNL